MGKGRAQVACAAAAAGGCALAGSSAFVALSGGAPRSATPEAAAGVVPQLSPAAVPALEAAPEAAAWGAASSCLALGVAASAAAASAAASRRRAAPAPALRAVAEPQITTGPFAGGLVGSNYHGSGSYEWDPLDLAACYPEHLPWYREAELKHGRVAMLAMVGLVAPDFVRLPFEACEDASLDIVNAHNKLIGPGLGEGPMWWLLVFCSVIESLRFKQLGLGFEKLSLENAGDIGFGNGFLPKSEEGIEQIKTKELKNGRLAMLAFSGAITQAVVWEVHTFPWVPTAASAVAEPQALSGGFAGGLVGSQYHGSGSYEWDPLELAARYPEHLPWYREAELKHGRVAMLAMVGLVAPDFVRLPFDQCSEASLDIVNAHNKLIGPGLGEGPMWWLLVFCSVIESLRFKQLGLGFEKLTLENAGDIGFGNGFLPKSEEGIAQIKTKELKNGRLAMLAFSGAITQAVVWEVHTFPWVPTAAGAVAEPQALPGGFAGGLVGSNYHGSGTYEWDPLDLAARYPEHLPWYREAELKHGRVAMLAMVGLVAPDFVRLPFGPCEDASLDIVNAHNKLIGPGLGEGPMWWLLVFCSVVESLRFKQLGLGFEKLTLENAGDIGFGNGFLPKSEEGIAQVKTKELKNGRLAMLAFSGAITQAVAWEVHTFPWVPTAAGAVAEPQALSGGFAGGLVGSDYHGSGKYEWDPLELAARYPEHLPWYREAELKHGRVAMLAMVGLVVPDFVRLPFGPCEDPTLDIVNAHNKLIGPGLGEGPMWWLLVFCSVVESLRFKQLGLGFEKLTLENAGDIGFGNGFLPKAEEGIAQIKTKELKNGRLAMLAFSGAITQGVVWEVHTFPWVPTAAGAVAEPQALTGGFAGGLVGSDYHGSGTYEWDPLELAARYPEHLPWYREAELKHGRVAMLAMVGLVVPDFVRLPFGPCEDVSLDIVNAHNKLIGPGLGEGPMWWLLVFCSVIESLRFKQLGLGFEKLTLENAGDIGFGNGFLPKSEEGIAQIKTKELKNGRLAMLAFSGAITQAVVWEVHTFPWVP